MILWFCTHLHLSRSHVGTIQLWFAMVCSTCLGRYIYTSLFEVRVIITRRWVISSFWSNNTDSVQSIGWCVTMYWVIVGDLSTTQVDTVLRLQIN